jgi:transcriptional regulator with XRE-family HTH domain
VVDDRKALGQIIRMARQAHGLTQAQLAAQITVCPRSIVLWENGTIRPRFKARIALTKALAIPLHQLVASDCNENPASAENTDRRVRLGAANLLPIPLAGPPIPSGQAGPRLTQHSTRNAVWVFLRQCGFSYKDIGTVYGRHNAAVRQGIRHQLRLAQAGLVPVSW